MRSTEDSRPEYLAALLATVPNDAGYLDLAQKLVELSHDFRRELAARLESTFNAHIQVMPHGTYEEKKTLSKWVNDELRRFDLAIKCPKTGNPSFLMSMPGHQPEVGRFAIEHKEADGKRVRAFTSIELPHLDLMESNPRREALAEWRVRSRQERGNASRG